MKQSSSPTFEGLQVKRPGPVAAVIPALNEAGTIAQVVRRTANFVEHTIVVDDGSDDGTLACLEGLKVESIRHERNRGKGESLLTGIQAAAAAGFDFVVTLDADGQHPPELIPSLVAMAEPRAIVLGARTSSGDAVPLVRYRANRTADFFISWAAGHWMSDTQCGFRVYPVSLFDEVSLRRARRSGFVLESEVLIEASRAGYRVKTVPVPALYESVLQRPSRFRPVFDTAATIAMVAWKLVSRGLFPLGFMRSRQERLLAAEHPEP